MSKAKKGWGSSSSHWEPALAPRGMPFATQLDGTLMSNRSSRGVIVFCSPPSIMF